MGKWEFFSSIATSYILLVALILNSASLCNGGITNTYVSSPVYPLIDMPFWSDVFAIPPGYNAPQQVHITQGDFEGRGVIVSWITPDEPGSNTVIYWPEHSTVNFSAEGNYLTYTFGGYYTSGYIHHCYLINLEYSTMYHYVVGIGNTTREFNFTTPPPVGPDAPYTFGIIGDLGQTYNANATLTHYQNNPLKGETLLYLGDFSYANDWPLIDQNKWDTWGRFIERSAAYQPWIWVIGNHEQEISPPLNETVPFKATVCRFPTPYKQALSTEPFYYSFNRASAHVIVLASYSSFGLESGQYAFLEADLAAINRKVTPWVIVALHAPWYSSYYLHYMEGESMRVQFESWIVANKIDVVFAGHVHAYERSHRYSNIAYNITNGNCTPIYNQDAPMYFTIGAGGNIEGLSPKMTEPQPSYSAYRDPSYGHGIFSIKNRTHAYFSYNRNQDGYAVETDPLWIYNRYWYPVNETSATILVSQESDHCSF